ncbi:MAG: cobalamin-dependent protein [Magnetococcales bacterium]|nr:cobalamin-dependent protein [Magnetococcales bacterium]
MRILMVMARQTCMQSYHLPMGIGYVSAMLKRAGHDVRVLNPNHATGELHTLLTREVKEFAPELLALGGMSFHANQIRQMAALGRHLLPHAPIVIGGTLVTNQPAVAMEAIPHADVGVVGEGEYTMAELVTALAGGTSLETVEGLIFRDREGILQRTPPRAILKDLDQLPWVDWEGVGLDVYASLHAPGEMAPGLVVDHGARVMPLLTSRGCPHTCTFCCHEIAGRMYRTRSLDDVFAELEYAIDRFGIDHLCILDDLFCLKRSRLAEFCERIRPMGLRWECSLRVEQVTPDSLRMMKESGLVCISFGVESMSDTVLQSMQKRTTTARLARALDLMYEARLTTWANLIFGDPAETLETATESMEWWARHNHFDLRIAFIGYHPGSRIHDHALQNGLIADPLEFLLQGDPEINATAMSDAQFRQMQNLVYRYTLTFGLPGRIIELICRHSLRIDLLMECPHCHAVLSFTDLTWGNVKSYRRSCRECNQLFRVPVRHRKSSPELASLHGELRALLTNDANRITPDNAKDLLILCERIIRIDGSADAVHDLRIQVMTAFGTPEQIVAVLWDALLGNRYHIPYFERMAAQLIAMGRNTEAEKFLRQAALLQRLGVTSPVDLPDH